MKYSLHIIQGGLENGDKQRIDYAKETKRLSKWIVPKNSLIGDEIVIYIQKIGFYATGKIASNPILDKESGIRYRAKLDNVKVIKIPISLSIIKDEIPELGWAKYPRSITTPEIKISKKIKYLIGLRNSGVLFSIEKNIHEINEMELRLAAYSKTIKINTNKTITVNTRRREIIIKRYALIRSKGLCEFCKEEAPFTTKDDGPFLEIHHPLPLSKKGQDNPKNVIALCPNCHRFAHYGNNILDTQKKMLDIVSQKEMNLTTASSL